jgi:hypothetical protein
MVGTVFYVHPDGMYVVYWADGIAYSPSDSVWLIPGTAEGDRS